MGVIPSSISVPLLLANIIRSQYSGSEVSDETMPYRGIWLMTKNIRSVSYSQFVSQSTEVCDVRLHGSAYPSPHELLIERHLGFRVGDFGEERSEGLYQIEESYCIVHPSQQPFPFEHTDTPGSTGEM